MAAEGRGIVSQGQWSQRRQPKETGPGRGDRKRESEQGRLQLPPALLPGPTLSRLGGGVCQVLGGIPGLRLRSRPL